MSFLEYMDSMNEIKTALEKIIELQVIRVIAHLNTDDNMYHLLCNRTARILKVMNTSCNR